MEVGISMYYPVLSLCMATSKGSCVTLFQDTPAKFSFEGTMKEFPDEMGFKEPLIWKARGHLQEKYLGTDSFFQTENIIS